MRRLLVIVNYNNDIGDYMGWSGQAWYAVNLSNDAYKLATNDCGVQCAPGSPAGLQKASWKVDQHTGLVTAQ